MQNQSGGTRIRWFGSTWIPQDTKSLDASWYDQIQHLRIRSRCENSRSSAQQFVTQTKTLWSDYLNFSESLRPAVVFKVSSIARIWFQFIFVFLVFFFIILHSSSIDASLNNLAVRSSSTHTLTARDYSVAEYGAEPRNLPVSAKFLYFLRNFAEFSTDATNMPYFGRFQAAIDN